ncbi:MAG: DNA-directed RNA polymerase subunit omega [Verrucomicrobiota bacterium]
MNSEFCRKAAEKVGNPNILVNLISRRVRQLTSGGGSGSRPLLSETAGLGAADIALLEIIEGKMGWDILDENPLAELPVKKRRRA